MVKLSYKVLVEFNGKIACIKEHCQDLGINPRTVVGMHHRTGKSYIECLEHYQHEGVRHKNNYKIKCIRLYRIWRSMLERCYNPKHPNYLRYGGKGITVCERWHKFEYFVDDMYKAYLWHINKYGEKNTSLDRIKNSRNYMENNCRWVTKREQVINRNEKHCDIILSTGETIPQFSERTHIPIHLIRSRLKLGWTIDEIIKPFIHNNPSIKYYLPCKLPLRYHCKKNGYNYFLITTYIKKYNLQPHEALAKWLENRQKRNKN